MQAIDYKSTQLQGITDLTVLCPIRPEFVAGAFETETHVERLRRVLAVLNGIRIFSREAAPGPSPFADSVGRFQSIHFFRFAIVDPAPAEALTGGHQLLLNVTFDGGWEPYMRLIWKPLGTMLDLIFCHNASYPQAWQSSFEAYCRWVREHEVRGRFFYADSAASVADAQYGKQLEALQRRLGGMPDADRRAAGLALPPPMGEAPATPAAVESALRVLRAVHGLIKLFPGQTQGDGAILLRFARELLADLRRWVSAGEFDPGGRYGALRMEPEISWLMQRPQASAATPERLRVDPAALQAGILMPFQRPPGATVHGALVLLRVADAALARAWLAGAPVSSEAGAGGDDPVLTLALTFPGLVALGLPASQRQKFPREFIDGMEARAGILGDVRGNHPQAWTRPPRNWVDGAQAAPVGAPVDLASVHVLVQLRTLARAGETGVGQLVLPRLQTSILALGHGTGLAVLAVQAGHSLPPQHGEAQPRNKFGFADGVSQPSLDPAGPPAQTWDDKVSPGELFLGYANDRGDAAPAAADPLLDDGSFLVVRKLRMFPALLDQKIAAAVTPGLNADTVRAKLMGRYPDGRNLVGTAGNDFDYRHDAGGSDCPLASHARRCNPRERRADGVMPPRLMRRGLSYGHESGHGSQDEVGLLFMAYNASIAEQFEVLQRWIAGGNSSGVSAAQDDPFMGVPEPGAARIFRFEHGGEVQRVDLGPQPLVSLQWGLYGFVPSLAALRALPALCVPDAMAAPQPLPLPDSAVGWKALLEDSSSREAAWAQVRLAGGVLSTPYGLLVGGKAQVQAVLKDDGGLFSTGGYGRRMAASIGCGFLGQDDVGAQAGHARPSVERVNAAIEAVTEAQAYDETLRLATMFLPRLMGNRPAAAVDLERLAGLVLAGLCTAWFGAPDGRLIKTGARSDEPAAEPLCPGHLVGMSRYVFSPDPSATVAGIAAPQGASFTAAVRKLLDAGKLDNAPLTRAILRAHGDDQPQAQAELIAGIMLGFPATVLGHLLTLLKFNAETRELWDWQSRLYSQAAPPWPAGSVIALLRGPLLAAMRRATVPHMVWRTAAAAGSLGGVPFAAGDRVVVGLGSALADGGDSMLIFGGRRQQTLHACSGYPMAVGVLLGFFTALLTAGELGSTPDPRVFNIRV